jgi:hypothetical protein
MKMSRTTWIAENLTMKIKTKTKIYSKTVRCACGRSCSVIADSGENVVATYSTLGWVVSDKKSTCTTCNKKK